MRHNAHVTDRVRYRTLAGVHLGQFRPGCSLPGIRDLAREMSVDHRAVSAAYHALEVEGLVEVRGRSGVYLTEQAWMPEAALSQEISWITELLVDAWKHRVPIPALTEVVRHYTQSRPIRCVCVESNEDCLVALCEELREDFGLDTWPVRFNGAPMESDGPPSDLTALDREIGRADLVVTLTFHAGPVREIADSREIPLVVVSVHPELSGAIEHRLSEGSLTFVVADPLFGERILNLHGAESAMRDRIRIVLADDAEGISQLDRSEPVFITRAARAKLGDVGLVPLLPSSPSISPECAMQLSKLIVETQRREAESGVRPVGKA
ncbi:MAG: GntR family transcriptional regulator [Chloroflexota bacterium]|nr:GntR family transcriptional regulator [Chloroflexota bacterium]